MSNNVWVLMDENDGAPLKVFRDFSEAADEQVFLKPQYPETYIVEVPFV